ncbi:sterol 3-beta-glucosyltransferase UGT80A2-like isoform X3 [Corylus avellana]|uniref:sterol 3-beta-glucosyltransferase UGT80A2-like isoform X3 n=1 Tax=Corylus avellana TaxID=13451 RepID=UPI00286AD01E|nr:sterol 3-beta-glucosyltransferase UGT80A2-like isoform X3 [Corylus avellana]
MAESSAPNHHRHRSSSDASSDISVDLEALPAAVDVNVDFDSSGEGTIEIKVTGSNSSTQSVPGEELAVGRSDAASSSSDQRRKSKQDQTLGVLAAKFFDEKVSPKKKLKWLKRVAKVKDDGTVQFEVPGDVKPQNLDFGTRDFYNEATDKEPVEEVQDIPPLQIVMLIVGTRGDVQPFVAIGKRLQEYGHRVRLATHANFKEFVMTAGLEFFPLGGDPKVLADYMVKNKGFLPSGPSEISIQRSQIKNIIFSLLPACKDPDPESKVPFTADAIIANPPAYGHTHVAEALRVPLHIFFTMPWTPTSEFPHPLSRVGQQIGYRLSYQIVDALIWLGIRDIINEFRKKKLKLRPVTYLQGSDSSPLEVPYGYLWSPHLVPKPKDWGPNIDVVGFCFLDLASNYQPPDSLVKWLEAGKGPIYVGFGSLVHHGGAGTTAAGLKAACPTTVIPFFGDQPFWGEQVHARGVGPAPIPVDEFSLDKLVDAIRFMLDPKVKENAVELAKAMENEDGVRGAVKAFHKHFPPKKFGDEPEPLPKHSKLLSVRECFSCS